jgi:hypothetical protein
MTTSRSDYNFGKGLRNYLDARGIRPSFIATKMGVSPQMMYQWQHSPDIRLKTAVKIANALDLSITDLVAMCYES